ncbi:S8 family serine peptidase, partial [Staphylococcus aureus]
SLLDFTGHGTLIAGVITSTGLSKGISNNIKIAPYKVLDSNGGDSKNIIEAIKQAVIDGHKVINISSGTYLSSSIESDKSLIKGYKEAVNFALSKNTIIVASSGNHYSSEYTKNNIYYYPACLKGVISVGALDKENKVTEYSKNNISTDLYAPGGSWGPDYYKNGCIDYRYLILSTFPTYLSTYLAPKNSLPSGYEFSLGSSLAAAQISATVSLLIDQYYAIHQDYPTQSYVKRILIESSSNTLIVNTFDCLKYLRKLNG